MYQVIFLPDAEESFKRLDKAIQKRIAIKFDRLAENADKEPIILSNLYLMICAVSVE